MAVPKKRISKKKKKIRRIHWKKNASKWTKTALITAKQVMKKLNNNQSAL